MKPYQYRFRLTLAEGAEWGVGILTGKMCLELHLGGGGNVMEHAGHLAGAGVLVVAMVDTAPTPARNTWLSSIDGRRL
jgi:hypothetical protein